MQGMLCGLRACPGATVVGGLLCAGLLFLSGGLQAAVRGDVAPRGMTDGKLNVADLAVMQQFLAGKAVPGDTERLQCDVAPPESPDGILNAADYLVLERAVLGLVTLQPLAMVPPPQLWGEQGDVTRSPLFASGLALPDSRVRLYRDGVLIGEYDADASGLFSAWIELLPGSQYTIQATNVYQGVESAPSASLVVSMQEPAFIDRALLTLDYGEQSYPAGSTGNDPLPDNLFVSGAAGSVAPGQAITLTLTDGATWSTTADADGSFSMALAVYRDEGGSMVRGAGVARISAGEASIQYATPGAVAARFGVSASGAAGYTIPVQVPPGTAGMAPELSVVFDSQGGDGPLGRGWSLGGLSVISRCPQAMAQDGRPGSINLDGDDRYCLDGQRLVAVSGAYGAHLTEYRTEIESFTRVVSYGGAGASPEYFLASTRSGRTVRYGFNPDAGFNPGGANIFLWAADRVSDRSGNYYSVSYQEDTVAGEHYPLEIAYTGNDLAGLAPYNRIELVYEARPDVTAGYVAGHPVSSTRRLAGIRVHEGLRVVKDYRLAYEQGPLSGVSSLGSITECESDAVDAVCLLPTRFGWSAGSPDFLPALTSGSTNKGYEDARAMDVNGDGRQDLVVPHDGKWWINYGAETGLLSEVNTGISTSGAYTDYSLVIDYDGNGHADLLVPGSDGYWDLLRAGAGGFVVVPDLLPNYGYSYKPRVIDINGDGLQDLMVAYNPGSGFSRHVYFNSVAGFAPAVNTGLARAGQNEIMLDYDSDGRADLLSAWYRGFIDGVQTCEWHLFHYDGQQFHNRHVTNVNLLANSPGMPVGCYDTASGSNFSRAADINGDHYVDLVYFHSASTGWKTVINSGRGLDGPDLPGDLSGGSYYYSKTTDFDLDGRADFLIPSTGDGRWHIYHSSGMSYTDIDTGLACNGYRNTLLMDVNGDGLHDIVSPYDGVWQVHLRGGTAPPDMLETMVDGLGNETLVAYRPLTDAAVYSGQSAAAFPVQDFHAPLHVVSQTRIRDGAGGMQLTDYTYSGAKVHLQGRGMQGFSEITALDHQTGVLTATAYRQDFPFTGLPERSETLLDGRLLGRVENSLARVSDINGASGVQFPYVAGSVETSYELPDENGNQGALIRTVTTQTSYDSYGNPLAISIDTSDSGGALFGKLTTNSYAPPDMEHWVLDRVSRTEVAYTASNVAAPHNRVVKSSAFSYYPAGQPGQFLLRDEIIEPDAGEGSPLYLKTMYSYDIFGNRTQVTTTGLKGLDAGSGSESRSTGTGYDSQGRFPIWTSNALGHTETYTHDARYGTKTVLTGPNGLTTTREFDGFGRQLYETRADGTATVWRHDFCSVAECPHGGFIETAEVSGSGPVRTWHDALQRPIRTATISSGGRTIYQDTGYDSRGNIARKSAPYFAGAVPQVTVFGHDVLNRPVQEATPDGGIVDYRYSTFMRNTRRHHVSDGYDQYDTRVNDAMDQLVFVIDAMGGSQSYVYDAAGNLISTSDFHGNTTLTGYDLRGRKISMDDPDMGSHEYRYNAFGELVWQMDANGRVVTMSYDRLGRLVSRNEPESLSSWTYDTAAMGIGKLALVNNTANTHSLGYYSYDSLGRLVSETIAIDGNSFTMRYSYDGFSRRATVSYPTGFMVRNVYDANGFLVEVRNAASGSVYWRLDEDDAAGHVTAETLGNGLQTLRTYQASSGTLESISTGGGINASVQNLGYVFDALGNLRSRADSNQGRVETFAYDALNRLGSTDIAGVGGRSYDYDGLGNIIRKSGFGDSYSYGANGAGPHAVTRVTQGGVTQASYTYDANGNMTGGDGRTISWSSFNKPMEIRKGATTISFAYDASHNRVKQVRGDHVMYYLSPRIDAGTHYEMEIDGGQVTHTHHIYAGKRNIAMYTQQDGGAGKTRYLHTDHLGSTDAITDETGQVVERMSFAAFGSRRHADWNNPASVLAGIETHHGFTGHEQLDEVGLVHMNGRLYDPRLGRFLSPDIQVQYPDQTQSFNRYTYVNNNPLSFTDPTGHGFFSKLWKQIRAVFSNPGALLAIAAGLLTGFATWATLGYGGGFIWGGTAMIAGISAAAGTVMATLIMTNGDLAAALKAGLISGLAAFAGVQVRQGIRDFLYGKGHLYTVSLVRDDPELYTLTPATAESVMDRLFVNGMLNDLGRAAELGLKQFNGQSFTLYHNPSHGFIADLTESALGKLFGGSKVSGLARELSSILEKNPNLSVIAHSQGGIISVNALRHLAHSGANLHGLQMTLNGSAFSERVSRAALDAVGGTLVAYNAHPLDLVPNVIALDTVNPLRVVGSILASPFLFAADSPHAAFY